MTGSVLYEKEGGIGYLTLSNPAIKNGLTMEMAAQIADHCDDIDADPTVACVVVRGDGGTFCSGADTSSWAETLGDDALSDAAYAASDVMYGSFYRFGQLGVPTIAAVRGAAVGAGLNLALAADLRVVADDARIMAGFLRAGIHPGGGFFTLMHRIAGREAAAALGLFSEEIDGRRAVELSLAWASVADANVEAHVTALACRIARDPVLARRVVRSFRLETSEQHLPWAVALELERGVQLWTQRRRLVRLAQDADGRGEAS